MKFTLNKIIDLDFFLAMDEDRETAEDMGARDREIYRDIERSGSGGPVDVNDDHFLLWAWLTHRRQAFARADNGGRLPGGLYRYLYTWTVRAAVVLGLITGFLTAYSFLAYHGSRPVNVTLFIAFFIVLQALLALAAGVVMVRRMRAGPNRGKNTNRDGDFRYPFFHSLIFEVFMGKLKGLIEKEETTSTLLARFRSGSYKGLLFWPLFMVPTLAGLSFSLGCLGATLFRVMVTDLAFGWQSTLFTSGTQVHQLVSALALPWSWILPDGAALPSLAQVEGSRIILKQGISGLATEHLAAWWSFLCMGILVYGVLPRLVIAVAAFGAGKKSLGEYDMNRPRYRRLLMRMRSPRMDMDVRETGGSRAPTRRPVPDPALAQVGVAEPEAAPPIDELQVQPIQKTEPLQRTQPPERPESKESKDALESPEFRPAKFPAVESQAIEADTRKNTPALVLASIRSYPDDAMDDIAGALDGQLGIDVAAVTRIGFDFETDEPALKGAAPPESGVVIILQEVWQPPIRGLLYYFTQLRKNIFVDHDLWIFLTRTPGEAGMGVDFEDMDFQVWKTAVAQLKDPGIIVERWMP